jgi:peptide/nickel transport system substrate-binding protein
MRSKVFSVFLGVLMTAGVVSSPAHPQSKGAPGSAVEPIVLTMADWPEMMEMARLLKPNWEKLGVSIDVRFAQLNSVIAQTQGEHRAPHLTASGWGGGPDRIDPDFFLTEFFHSKRAVKGGQNYGDYINPEYDRLVDAQRTEMDEGKRLQLVKQVQQMIYRDRPGMVLYYIDYVTPYRTDRIDGAVPVMGNGVGLAYIPWTYLDGKVKKGRPIIKTLTQYDITTLNPFATGEVTNSALLRWAYAPLVMRDKDTNLVPWAAESWREIDPTTMEVTIRPGMKFTDGVPVTAADLKFTFDFINQWKFPSYARFTGYIGQVDQINDRTVRIHLTQPYAPFVANILGSAFITPKHIWEQVMAKNPDAKSPAEWPNPEPVGVGPYKLVQWKTGEYIKFAVNKDWFNPPHFDEVYWLIVPSIDSELGMLERGEADLMAWNLTPSQMQRLSANGQIAAPSAPSHAPREIRFNLSLPPFDDVNMRRAFSMAVDRKQLVNTLLDGAATVGNDAYISPKLQWADNTIKVPEFDIEGARKLLKDGGYTWDSEGKLHYPAK